MAAKKSGLEALTDMFKEPPYIKDKEGLGYSDVGDAQYPRYLCLGRQSQKHVEVTGKETG